MTYLDFPTYPAAKKCKSCKRRMVITAIICHFCGRNHRLDG